LILIINSLFLGFTICQGDLRLGGNAANPKVMYLTDKWIVIWKSIASRDFNYQLFNTDGSTSGGISTLTGENDCSDIFGCEVDKNGKFSIFVPEENNIGVINYDLLSEITLGIITSPAEDDYLRIGVSSTALNTFTKISTIYLPGSDSYGSYMTFVTLVDHSVVFYKYQRERAGSETISSQQVFLAASQPRHSEFAALTDRNGTGNKWVGVYQECSLNICDIYFKTYDDTTAASPTKVTNGDERYVFPSVHRLGNGGFIVVYKMTSQNLLETSIIGRTYDSTYSAPNNQFEIKSPSSYGLFRPLVMVSPFDVPVVGYEERNSSDIYLINFYDFLPSDGVRLNTVIDSLATNLSYVFGPIGNLGAAYIAWDNEVYTNILPKSCSNYDIYIKQQGGNLDNYFGVGEILFTNLPSSGNIVSGEKDVITHKFYDAYTLKFIPGNISTQYFNFRTNYEIFENNQSCTGTINFCYVSCGSCFQVGNSSDHKCTSCNENYFPKEDKTSDCHLKTESVPGYYFNTDEFSRCSANCDLCDINNKCTQCTIGNFLLDGVCYTNCPAKYFNHVGTQTCKSCRNFCDVCPDANTCTTCSPTFYLKADNSCTSDCPLKYFENNLNGRCESCPSNCDDCSDGLTCSTCSCNFFLRADNNCYDTCPFGQYGDSNLRRCVSCPLFYMTGTNDCVDSCPIGYYHSLGSNECKPCINNCDICSNGTECTLCSEGFLNRTTDSCTNNLAGYFNPNDGDRKWKECPSNCATCTSETYCTSCNIFNFFLPFVPEGSKMCGQCPNAFTGNVFSGNCESDCVAGQFYDRCPETCSTCNSLCSSCQDDTNYCSNCVSTAYSWDSEIVSLGISNQCLNQCPFNYFYNFNRQCRTCKDLGYFQFGQQCEDFCPEGYFKDLDSHLCVECTGQDVFRYKDTCIDTSARSFRDLLVLDGTITYETVDKLYYLKYAMLENPSNFNFDLVGLITQIANNQTSFVLDGRIRPSQKLFSLISTALRINIIYASQNETVQIVINQLLENIHLLSHHLIKQYNTFGLFVYTSDEYNLVISDSSDIAKITQQSYALNMSIIETGECVAALTKDYDLDAGSKILIKKVDLSFILNLNVDNTQHDSHSIILEFYHPSNHSKLSTDACNESSMIVKTRNNQALNINTSLYRVLREKNFDILDSNSQFYQDRCLSILDPVSGKDTTVGFRIRNFFQNTTVLCAPNCDYAGLEENGYVVCDCSGVINYDEPINRFVDSVVVANYSTINHEVIKCFPHVWEQEQIRANPAFWSIMFIMIIGWIIFLTMRNCGNNLIESSLDELIDNDCSTERLHYKKVASSKVLPSEKNTGKELVIEVNNEDPPKNENAINAEPVNTENVHYTHTPYHQSTSRMYQLISPYKLSKEDNRSFLTLFKSFLIEEHFLVRIVYYRSLLNPLWVELYFFLFRLSVLFMMNALIFIDEYIDKRITSPYKDEFSIAWTREFPRTILSLIGAILVTAVFSIFTITPKSVENELSESLKVGDKELVKKAHEQLKDQMMLKYILFVVITTLLNIFIWFFTISFCGIYVTSANGWVVGTFVGLCILDWIFLSIGIPLIRATLRVLIRIDGLRFLAGLEWLFWITKPFRR